MPQPPSSVRDKLETTTHGTSGRKTYKLGLTDTPDFSLKLLYKMDAAQLGLITARDAGTELWFRAEVPSEDNAAEFFAWEWQGYVNKADPLTPIGGVWEFDVGIMYSDNYTFYSDAYATQIP
jgi:hypothetical protein